MSYFFKVSVITLSLAVATSAVAQNSQGFAISPAWTTPGFAMPESVASVPNHPWLYVSNVNGDAVGFVSRVSPNGEIEALKWANGIQTPTGMAAYDSHSTSYTKRKFIKSIWPLA